jgi:hypothetical protein
MPSIGPTTKKDESKKTGKKTLFDDEEDGFQKKKE